MCPFQVGVFEPCISEGNHNVVQIEGREPFFYLPKKDEILICLVNNKTDNSCQTCQSNKFFGIVSSSLRGLEPAL
jgi:hypothetical protein